MRRTAREFRLSARKALDGRYWWAVLASLIAGMLGAGSTGSVGMGGNFNYRMNTENWEHLRSSIETWLGPEVVSLLAALIAAIISMTLLVSITLFFVGSAVELGYNDYYVRLYKSRETPALSGLFSRFSIFGRALWLRVLMMLKILAWTLLFIVPGIIATYRYAMAPYLMAENPELTASEAIEKSKAMMDGNKGRLFCLELSFIGWFLLAALTMGIGYIFLTPYVKAAVTAFYMELSGRLPADAAAGQTTAQNADAAAQVAPTTPALLAENGPEQL